LQHCTVVSNSGLVQVYSQNTVATDEAIFGGGTGNFNSSAGHNLIVSTNGCILINNTSGNLYGVDPLLGPLQNNGGLTFTHALLLGSPAINAGGAADTTPFDQRGVPRPQGPASDIGAYEFSYTPPALARMAMPSRTNCWLQWSGLPNAAFTLQASTNCITWFSLTNSMCDPNGLAEFLDADASKYLIRFYRLAIPVPSPQ
jgi:hypothetical protein